jgi:hypothetical protein
MTPSATLETLLSVISSALFIPMVAAANRGTRSRVIAMVVIVALLSMLVGTQQVAGADNNIFQFYQTGSHSLRGFQRNRNSEADVLLLAMLGTAACAAELLRLQGMARRRTMVLCAIAALSAVFMIGVVLTGSRTGAVLLLPTMLGQAVLLRRYVSVRLSLAVIVLLTLSIAGGAIWCRTRPAFMMRLPIIRMAWQPGRWCGPKPSACCRHTCRAAWGWAVSA